MARSSAIQEHPGFTVTHYANCCICDEPINPDHQSCKCGALILPVRFQPKQEAILNHVMATGPNVPTWIGFGGSRAAGKSRGGRDLALTVAAKASRLYPGITIYIFRRNWTQVKDTHLAKYKLERPMLTRFYSDKEYEFPDSMHNPRIAFNFADTPDDVIRVTYGPEGYLLIIDQAEQLRWVDIQALKAVNRWPGVAENGAKMLLLFNWGGPGSADLKRVFWDKNDYRGTEKASQFAYEQAWGWDNWAWFSGENIQVDGKPLTWDSFYELPGDVPPCDDGKYTDKWLHSLPAEYDNNRFKLFVTRTAEGIKQWEYPDAIRMGWLFGRPDSFENQAFAGVWNKNKVVLR